MARRLRTTDGLALVGLFVLLFAFPAYATQEGTAADAHTTHAFRIPMPRAGDTLTTELVLQRSGAEPVVVGPYRTLTARQPVGAECPPTTAFVLEAHQHAGVVAFPGGTVNQEGSMSVRCHAADGTPLATLYQGSSGGRTFWRFDGTNAAPADSGKPVRYSPDLLYHWSVAVGMTVREALSDEPRNGPITSDRIATYGGFRLYSDTGGLAATGGGILPLPRSPSREMHTLDGVGAIQLAPPIPYSAHESWSWYSPAVPFPVGGHTAYLDADGAVFSIDELPRAFVPGNGGDLQKRPFSYRESNDLPVLGDTEVPSLRLGGLSQDARPVYGDLSLRALMDAVERADLPVPTRAVLDAGGFLGGFVWHTLPAGPDGTRASSWALALTTHEGAVNVVEVELHEADPWRVVRAEDACNRANLVATAGAVRARCETLAPALVDPDRRVTDPLFALSQAAAHQGRHHRVPMNESEETLHSFAYAPVYVAAPYNRPEAAPLEVRTRLNGRLPTADPERPSGVAWWRDENGPQSTTGILDLRDGSLLRAEWSGSFAETLSLGPASAAQEQLHIYAGTGAALTVGGALLVLVGLVARGLAWAKGGGALPGAAFLYARIQRSEALEHERRELLIHIMRETPGLTLSELHRRTGYGWGATVYHLQTLRRTGLAAPTRVANRAHWFAAGTTPAAVRLEQAFRTRPEYERFLGAVASKPGITLKEMEATLAQKRSALSKLGTTLADAGVIEKKRDGMHVRFFPARPETSPTP